MNAEEELARIDSLRVTCPTCDGKGVVVTPDAVGKAFFAVLDKGKGAGVPHLTCPDCADGRMSWDRIVAIAAAVAADIDEHGTVTWQGARDYLLHSPLSVRST